MLMRWALSPVVESVLRTIDLLLKLNYRYESVPCTPELITEVKLPIPCVADFDYRCKLFPSEYRFQISSGDRPSWVHVLVQILSGLVFLDRSRIL